jgi:tetratricopeptide (TPR) repeat protein
MLFLSSVTLAAQGSGRIVIADQDVIRDWIQMIGQGKAGEVIAAVDASIEKQGPTEQLLWVKGEALRSKATDLGGLIEAGKAYTESIKLNPRQTDSHYGRAMVFLNIGSFAKRDNEPDHANKAFLNAINDASRLRAGRSRSMLMVRACEGLERKLETIRHLNDLIKYAEGSKKDLAVLYTWRASSLDAISAHDLAAHDLLASHRLNPKLTPLGKVLSALDSSFQFEKMIAITDELIADGNSDARVLVNRLSFVGKAGRVEEAIEGLHELKQKNTDLETSEEIDTRVAALKAYAELWDNPLPDEVAAKISDAQELLNKGSYDLAYETALKAVSIEKDAAPFSTEAKVVLGNVLLKQGRFEEAIAVFSRAIQFRSKLSHEKRAAALTASGLIANSVFDLEAACKDTTNPDLPFRLADALQKTGRFSEAVAAYDHAERLGHPNVDKKLNSFRGYCYWRAGERQKAVRDLEVAIHAKEHAQDQLTIAIIYEELGRFSDAKSSYARAKELLESPTEVANRGISEKERDFMLAAAGAKLGVLDQFAELQTHMRTFLGIDEATAKQRSAALAPTLEVCQAVFDDEFAKLAAATYAKAWQSGSVVIGSSTNANVLVDATTSGEIISGHHEFAGDWDKVARHLRPGNELFMVRFVKPGETQGVFFEGFFKFKDQWYLLPKPWRLTRTDQPKKRAVSTTHNGIRLGVTFDSPPDQVSGVGKEPAEEKHVFVLGNDDGTLMFAIDEFPNLQVSTGRCIEIFSKLIGGEITNRETIEIQSDEIEGERVDFVFSGNGGGFARSRFYLIGKRWINVVAMGSMEFVDSQRATDFLESVAIEDVSEDQKHNSGNGTNRE